MEDDARLPSKDNLKHAVSRWFRNPLLTATDIWRGDGRGNRR